MAYIIETPNPFQPTSDLVKHEHEGGITINQWLRMRHPGFEEFDEATICLLNGQPLMRKDWDHIISPADIINFITCPQGFFLIITLVLLVASVAVSLFLGVPPPGVPGEQPASDPVFSTKGQSNSIRLGEPIECPYGKNRLYPSYASRPYFQYIDNDQFQYTLFCIGQGYYEIESIQIGDSDINQYQEVTYEVVEPGGTVSLFPTNVYTSVEAGGQELLGPNEDGYTDDGWVGPFDACASGSTTGTIQVDVVFPRGLYNSNNDGGLNQITVDFEIEAREIDDSGTPIGLYFALTGSSESVSGTTTTPQRRTLSAAVTPLRYEVRMRRTSNRQDSHRIGDQIQWEGLKSYITDAQDFGDVTLLAVKIRATNNLNDRTQQRFNVICTRKLQQHQSDGFTTTYYATRSIIWALVDVFRSQYGGRITDDTFYDWDALYDLEAEYITRGEYFDFVFRDPITVWEAARTICRAGRAVPLIVGSLLSMKRDGALTTPVAMFTQDNIIKGSFTWDVKLWETDEFDSILMEYTDPNTNYKQETVLATLPFGTTTNPRSVRMVGVQDRDHAYHEALYMLAVDRYQRENITFETGLEGYIPTFGDLIVISHDVPRWSSGGMVLKGESESNGDFHLWLSEPVEFESNATDVIYLRKKNGDVLGPYTCSETTDPNQVRINTLIDIDFLEGGEVEQMLYVFGQSGQVNKFARVVKIEPQGNEIIRITAVNEDSTVHSFDSLTAPALEDNDTVPQIPELPTVASITVTQLNTSLAEVEASWGAAFGSQYYIVQESFDNVIWTNVAETTRTSIAWQTRPGALYVRVAGVNYGQGAWATTAVSIGSLAGIDIETPFADLDWGISWLQVLNALSYDVKVYDNTTPSTPVLRHTTNILFDADRAFDYLLADAVNDGMEVRDHLVTVTPKFKDADGTPAELELTNPIPGPPTSPASAADSAVFDSAGDYLYNLSWVVPTENDLITVKVWASETDGFTPGPANLQFEETQSGVGHAGIPTSYLMTWPADSYGEHGPIKWIVGVFDIWGEEISTNVTAQQDIDPTSGWAA